MTTEKASTAKKRTSKKTAATNKSQAKTEQKPKSIATPECSKIKLDYSRYGNIGLSQTTEIINISNVNEKGFRKKIIALFHFVRSTKITSKFDSGRTVAFLINEIPVLSFTQKAGDFEDEVFTLTKYRADGKKQSTRKYDYLKSRKLILSIFGFEVKDSDEDEEASEELDISMMYGEINDFENAACILDNDESTHIEIE